MNSSHVSIFNRLLCYRINITMHTTKCKICTNYEILCSMRNYTVIITSNAVTLEFKSSNLITILNVHENNLLLLFFIWKLNKTSVLCVLVYDFESGQCNEKLETVFCWMPRTFSKRNEVSSGNFIISYLMSQELRLFLFFKVSNFELVSIIQ